MVDQVCSHLLILRKGDVIACDSTQAIRNSAVHSSLEQTFMDLVQETATDRLSTDIIQAMQA